MPFSRLFALVLIGLIKHSRSLVRLPLWLTYHPCRILPLLRQDHPCSQPIALTYSDEKEGERERSWVCESEIEKKKY